MFLKNIKIKKNRGRSADQTHYASTTTARSCNSTVYQSMHVEPFFERAGHTELAVTTRWRDRRRYHTIHQHVHLQCYLVILTVCDLCSHGAGFVRFLRVLEWYHGHLQSTTSRAIAIVIVR